MNPLRPQHFLLFAALPAIAVLAQDSRPSGRPAFDASVSVATPLGTPAPAAPVVLPAATPPAATITATTTTTPVTAPPPAAVAPNGGVLLNFQGASLNDVLAYLSEAAGFVIVQEAPVTGTVNIVSRQPLNAEEAVDLLNTVLVEKGYTAIRNGRILKIVNRRDAPKRDLPVALGSNPEDIPRKDAVVTQVLPLRFGEAAKLVENLRPLLSDSATIAANDASNAVILTDTQTNIRRIAQIIRALDTSVASISTINVFPLKFADAKEVADIITQLFAPAPTTQQGPQGRGGGRGGFGGGGGFAFGGGPGGAPGAPAASEARSAASRVVSVADEQSNSVIVSAPEEMISTIRQMIEQIDTSITDVTDTRIFRLVNADSTELAQIVNDLFSETGTNQTGSNNGGQRNGAGGGNNNNRNQRGGNNQGNRGGFGGFPGFPFGGQQGGTSGANASERSLLQSKVNAVGDPRTNSLVVTAARDTMSRIAEIVTRLDATTAKRQHVYTHSLEHADPDTVANVLRGMLGQQTTTVLSGSSRLNDRQTQGAAINTDLSSSSGRSSR